MNNFSKIEKKWQARWEKEKAFEVKENSKKKKFYVLEQFPYPSGSGLHMGHAFIYTIGDVYARFKRMQGFNVLYPMGFDSFGLPAENAAIKAKSHPKKFTEDAIKNFVAHFKSFGNSYDWSRMIETHKPDFYKWDQWIFLKMFEKGLAYRKKAPVNWCGKCNTVLANEQVVDGKCWRHEDTKVEVKNLEQWFFKTTEYADELYSELDKLENWPELIKTMQKNWIGKSEGAEIDFEIESKISNCVIVHGSPSKSQKEMSAKERTYDKHWYPWLKKELEKNEIKAETPLMPTPWEPKYSEWKKIFEKIKIDENSVLIGHSAGGGFLVRWLGETKKKIRKLILVAPAIMHSGNFVPLADLLKFEVDNTIKNNVDEIKIFVSNNDSKGIIKSVEIFSKCFNVEPTELKEKGHFTKGDMGTEEFPELLEEITSGKKWKVFTTRTDTLFGVTFLVVSAQHPNLNELVTKEQKKKVDDFLKKIKSTKQEDLDKLGKEGVFTGSYATHPLTKEKIPIWAGNFVVAEYGSGMVMAVPAHDQRDFEFAKKYDLPIKEVVAPIFVSTDGVDKIAEGKPFVERNAVAVILKHWSEEKYAVLKWKKVAWHTLITGGIEKNQTPEEAAIAEIKEETGYLNPKLIKNLGMFHSKFFHKPKNENRFGHFHAFYFKLKNDARREIEESENEKHEIKWLSFEEAIKSMTAKSHEYLLRKFKEESAFSDYGILMNSEAFNDLESSEAKEHIIKNLEFKKLGRKKIQYRLRDWLISRQRFWGTPIPIIYCDDCGIVPVKEKDLPVKLPEEIKFSDVKNPLVDYDKFTDVKCPKCGGTARRETDTMDTFVNSSWYFLRYCDSKNEKEIFDKKKANYWMPIDVYIGGKEHAVMHDIYFRFYTKFLRDLGLLEFDEPAVSLFNQGFVYGSDGRKMSKSYGNVVLPEDAAKKYGVDATRMFLVSVASPEKDFIWSDAGAEGSLRFVNKILNSVEKIKVSTKSSEKIEHVVNKAIKKISLYIDKFEYNFAVIELRKLFDNIEGEISRKDLESCVKMLSPFCPHIAEELWEKIGKKNLISLENWPEFDEKKINEKFDKMEESFDKTISDILNVVKIVREKNGVSVSKIFVYALPMELEFYDADSITKRVGISTKVFAVNDKNKYDPAEKASKAKFGKPAIFVE